MRITMFFLIALAALLPAGCIPVASRLAPAAESLWAQRTAKALDWADKAHSAYQLYEKLTAAPAMPNRPMYPGQLQQVWPVSQPYAVNPAAGIYAAWNNLGG